MLQKDLSTLVVIMFCALAMYFLSGTSLKHNLLIVLAGLVSLAALIKFEAYRFERFLVFIKPDIDPMGVGYQLKQALITVGSGGIFGMGEARADRVKMAFELKRFRPECLPLNLLNPIPGTPLEKCEKLPPAEVLKTIAVYRFILPKSNIKLAGGRELNLGEHQESALKGGANGLIVGGYLTTAGNPIKDDFEMLGRAGYEV